MPVASANPVGSFFYDFTDSLGNVDEVTVTLGAIGDVSDGTTDYGSAYGVTAITGTIDGTDIDGVIGNAGSVQTSNGYIFDNAVFESASSGLVYGGASGNLDGIDVGGFQFSIGTTNYNLYTQNGEFVLLGDGTDILTLTGTDAPCFCAGTMILTDQGEVAVEALAIGDMVITASGALEAVRWIGRRAIASRFADPVSTMPVRIAAGALADHVPVRDVLLSPCHAVLVDGVLAHAGALVNGGSITREARMPEIFTYYHVELASHSLIMVDGMAAETFVDNADRMNFDNWAEHRALFGDAQTIPEMDYPRAKAARQLPMPIRARLAGRIACRALAGRAATESIAA